MSSHYVPMCFALVWFSYLIRITRWEAFVEKCSEEIFIFMESIIVMLRLLSWWRYGLRSVSLSPPHSPIHRKLNSYLTPLAWAAAALKLNYNFDGFRSRQSDRKASWEWRGSWNLNCSRASLIIDRAQKAPVVCPLPQQSFFETWIGFHNQSINLHSPR